MKGLTNGWNYIRLPIREANKNGNPDLGDINWFRFYQFKKGTIQTKIDGIQLIGDGIYTEVELTVNNGSGSGSYEPGDQVTIQANASPEGEVFDRWEINSGTTTLEKPGAFNTTVTMQDTDAGVTATYTQDPSVSVNPMEKAPAFTLYPNPARKEVRIGCILNDASEISITLHNLTGKQVKQVFSKDKLPAGNHHLSVAVGDLTPGSYLVKCTRENRVTSRLLLIGQ